MGKHIEKLEMSATRVYYFAEFQGHRFAFHTYESERPGNRVYVEIIDGIRAKEYIGRQLGADILAAVKELHLIENAMYTLN